MNLWRDKFNKQSLSLTSMTSLLDSPPITHFFLETGLPPSLTAAGAAAPRGSLPHPYPVPCPAMSCGHPGQAPPCDSSLNVDEFITALLFICLVFYVPIIDTFLSLMLSLNTSSHWPVFCCFPWRVYSWDHIVLLHLGRCSLTMLRGSYSHFQLLENWLGFACQHPFLIPFLVLAGARERSFGILCLGNVSRSDFPWALEGIVQLPLASPLRGWSEPQPFTRDLFSL